jgi:hypothetical protein
LSHAREELFVLFVMSFAHNAGFEIFKQSSFALVFAKGGIALRGRYGKIANWSFYNVI